jgi:hypothetical protein
VDEADVDDAVASDRASAAADIGVCGREAVVDLVLAEELSVDHDFARWFLSEAVTWRNRPQLPPGDLERVLARVNYWDDAPDLPLEDQGETDIDLTFRWADGHEVSVLIEDKVWAVFQDHQPERYAARARSRGGWAVLVAPASYLAGHSEQGDLFDGVVTIEAIAARIRARPPAADPVSMRRAEWRAQLLDEVIRPRPQTPATPDPNTVAFTEFCASWLAHHAPEVVPNPRSNHTRGQGWLWFDSPSGLAYKASGWARRLRAGVDLYVGEHGFTGTAEELEQLVDEIGLPDGFFVTTDTAKKPNVVLRYECDIAVPSEGPPARHSDRERGVIEALQACVAAATWLRQHEHRLAGG